MKHVKNFATTVSFSKASKVNGSTLITHLVDLTVCGVAYYYPDEEEDYDFDIDEVFFEHKNILPALLAMGINLKTDPAIYWPVLAHMNYLFADSISGSLKQDAA